MAGLTPDWMPELFFCHRYEFAFIADFLGYRIGTRADQVDTNRVHEMLDDDIKIDFVDNNFKNPDRDRLETIVSLRRQSLLYYQTLIMESRWRILYRMERT